MQIRVPSSERSETRNGIADPKACRHAYPEQTTKVPALADAIFRLIQRSEDETSSSDGARDAISVADEVFAVRALERFRRTERAKRKLNAAQTQAIGSGKQQDEPPTSSSDCSARRLGSLEFLPQGLARFIRGRRTLGFQGSDGIVSGRVLRGRA
jgi:hypothetical protein